MECKWLAVERRALSWERDSKSKKYENREVEGLMWATVPTQQGMETLPQKLLLPWDAVMGADGETRPTDSANSHNLS